MCRMGGYRKGKAQFVYETPLGKWILLQRGGGGEMKGGAAGAGMAAGGGGLGAATVLVFHPSFL